MSSGENFHQGNEYCALYIFPLKIKELKSNIKNSKKKKKKKNPPVKKETPVQFLGQKDPLEKG